MSDFEPRSARAQTAAPITQLATGKLRGLSAGSALFAETDGLIDAFAEVFARMAVASPPPVQTGEATGDESGHDVAADNATETQQAVTTSQNESDESNSGDDIDAGPIQILNGPIEQTAVTDEIQVDRDPAESHIDVASIDESIADEVDAQQLILKPQRESEQLNIVQQADDSPEIVAAVTTVASDQGQERRERRDSQQVQTIDGSEVSHIRSDSDSRSDSSAHRDVDVDRPIAEVHSDSDAASDENPRDRSRGRTRGEKSQAVDQSRGQRPAEQPGPTRQGAAAPGKPEATEWAAELTRSQDVSAQQVQRAPITVNAAAAVAAQATSGANTSAVSAPNARGPAQPSTQPVDPSTSTSKTQPRPKSGGQDSQGTTTDLVSRAKLIQRVSKAFQHLGAEGGQVRIRLAPPDLGSVRVEIRIQQRKIRARVIAESEAASNALREHLPDLRARLESQGMQIDKIEIETESGDNAGSLLGDTHEDHRDGRHHQSFGRRPRQPEAGLVSQSVSQGDTASGSEFVNRSTAGVDVRL